MGLGWRQACQVGSGRLSSLLGGSGDGDVGGGGGRCGVSDFAGGWPSESPPSLPVPDPAHDATRRQQISFKDGGPAQMPRRRRRNSIAWRHGEAWGAAWRR